MKFEGEIFMETMVTYEGLKNAFPKNLPDNDPWFPEQVVELAFTHANGLKTIENLTGIKIENPDDYSTHSIFRATQILRRYPELYRVTKLMADNKFLFLNIDGLDCAMAIRDNIALLATADGAIIVRPEDGIYYSAGPHPFNMSEQGWFCNLAIPSLVSILSAKDQDPEIKYIIAHLLTLDKALKCEWALTHEIDEPDPTLKAIYDKVRDLGFWPHTKLNLLTESFQNLVAYQKPMAKTKADLKKFNETPYVFVTPQEAYDITRKFLDDRMKTNKPVDNDIIKTYGLAIFPPRPTWEAES